MRNSTSFWLLLALVGPGLGPPLAVADDTVSFNREIRPLLAKHCFTCHGPDEDAREGGLRFDTFDGATDDLGGYRAVAAGDPAKSELIVRVSSDDPDLRMPPAEVGERLTPTEITQLSRWIEQGAVYETHWAFVPPTKPPVPAAIESWAAGAVQTAADSPIDRFVQARLQAVTKSLSTAAAAPSPPADRYTLARRLYLDLTGLPPSIEQADAFVHDPDPLAYIKLVDRLLGTPEFAEHTAQQWLDLARYADTNGYEKDRERTMWPFRDWVLRAIASDMPYDQFSIEQLAGDMLPGATNAQQVATGFHRNTMLNEEGGIDPLEYRFQAMVDRVATTGTVWMGLTTGCAQCHTHKYDPLTHTDYYALMALLNNADEPDLVVADPIRAAERVRIETQIEAAEAQLAETLLGADLGTLAQNQTQTNSEPTAIRGDDAAPSKDTATADAATDPVEEAFQRWLHEVVESATDWTILTPTALESTMPRLVTLDDGSILASGDVTKRDVYKLTFMLDQPATALRLEVLPHPTLPANGPGMAFYEGRKGDFFLSECRATLNGQPVEFADASHDYGKISVGSGKPTAESVFDGEGSTGWSTSGREGQPSQLVVNLAKPLTGGGELEMELLFERHFAAALGHFRIAVAQEKSAVKAYALPAEFEARLAEWKRNGRIGTVPQLDKLKRHFIRTAEICKPDRSELDALTRHLPAEVRSPVFRQRPDDHQRVTRRHHRGEYLQPRESVAADIPELFGELPEDQPRDRLALARWLASDRNPLVARVTVNRVWRALFGFGIVRTEGDFGTQSQPPSHPRLLDYLATEWMENGWSMKWLYRQIVLSATYRQSSHRRGDFDPENIWLARGPRFRMPGEAIRDQYLINSGRLTRRIGGPSVRPPQPRSVTELAYGNTRWQPSSGGERYRRSLYTFRKRTAPFAAYAVFDAPTGEVCIARRQRSDTPLQALTLLNDALFLELATELADHVVAEVPADLSADAADRWIAERIFRTVLIRPPTADELSAILDFHQQQLGRQVPSTQAWHLVTRAIMNTDEAITKP